jgi:hypothetical protein
MVAPVAVAAPVAAAARVAVPRPAPAPAAAPTAESSEPLHWRDALCDWAAAVLATPRHPRPLPAVDGSRLDAAGAHLGLLPTARRALALLYGARLLGHADLPAVTVARALGEGAPSDDTAWAEALGQGALAERHLARARRGRLALRAVAARFLDGAPPHVALLPGPEGGPEEGGGAVRVAFEDDETLTALGHRLVDLHGRRLALIAVDALAAFRSIADGLAEARLHDAWPVLEERGDAADWWHALDGGPLVIATRGEPHRLVFHLPEL